MRILRSIAGFRSDNKRNKKIAIVYYALVILLFAVRSSYRITDILQLFILLLIPSLLLNFKDSINGMNFFIQFVICVTLIIGMNVTVQVEANNAESQKEKSSQAEINRERELEKNKKEKDVLSRQSISNWIEYNKDTVDANYDVGTKIISITSNFSRTLSVENRIEVANYDIYKRTKELENLFKDDIESYKFDFLAELVDQYGNKRNDVVYTIILNRKELNSVNWNDIQPSMLINLASHNYKNPVIH